MHEKICYIPQILARKLPQISSLYKTLTISRIVHLDVIATNSFPSIDNTHSTFFVPRSGMYALNNALGSRYIRTPNPSPSSHPQLFFQKK